MANLSPITRNVTRHDISEWRQDNKYIFAGYCPLEAGYLQYLIGAILLPLFATAILQTIYRPQHINIIRTDFIIFTIFFYSGESCLIFSAVYDLIRSHLYKVEYTVSTFIPGQKVRIGAYVVLGVSAFIPLLYGHLGMKWYLMELLLYGGGCGLYAIFYISILCAIYVHMIALTQDFIACYTLDICHI
ncbi:mPR-like GPCR protein [Fusarium oxysporum f. sp. albedinis]|nr:mPR-like GPCR protein [Fusarium oxysporum f. sp. albedinis]